MIHERIVFDVYQLRQFIGEKPERRTYLDRLLWTQTITHNIRTRKLTDTLTLSQSIGLRRSVYNLKVGHSIGFVHRVGKAPVYLEVFDYIALRQSVQRHKWGAVTSLLKLDQTVDGQASKAVTSNLQFNQTVVGNVLRHRTVTDNIGLISGVSAWLMDPNFNYLNPTFSEVAKVRFKYNGTTIYLRKPDFDDTYKYDFTRLNQRTRGGDLIIGRDSIWPKTKSFVITFTYLSEAEIDHMLNFMKITLGKRCRYLNYDNVEWEGFITNPQTEARQLGRSNRSMSIDFEGEPL